MVVRDLEGVDLKLQYVTHDARRIVNEYGFDLNLYWSVRLMEMLFNYNAVTVGSIIKGKAKDLPGHPGYHIIKESMGWIGRQKRHNNAVFSNQAVANLYRIDRSLLVADYTVKLDVLALTLDRMTDEDVTQIIAENDKCGLSLLLIKIEEYMGKREHSRRDVEYVKYRPPKEEHPSDAAKTSLKEAIQDIMETEEG